MAGNLEIIKTISTLLSAYNGEKEKLESVLDALDIIETLVTEANRATVINVVLAKFTGKARNAFTIKPETIAAVKTKQTIEYLDHGLNLI